MRHAGDAERADDAPAADLAGPQAYNSVASVLATEQPPLERHGDVTPVTDWIADLDAASSPAKLQAVLTRVLAEIRSLCMSDVEAAQLGGVAGGRLWQLAKLEAAKAAAAKTGGLGYAEHYQPMAAMLEAIADAKAGAAGQHGVSSACDALAASFTRAARGRDDVGFPAAGPCTLRILVTGFDPFAQSGLPGAADWNRSAAAALALDGMTIADKDVVVAIQSVILPNSAAEFDGGIAERVLAEAGADGVLSVGIDPNITSRNEVRIERFMINLQSLGTPGSEPIPAAPGGLPGPAVLESSYAVEVAAAMNSYAAEVAAKTNPGSVSPLTASPGAYVDLKFGSEWDGLCVLHALGATGDLLTPTITDPDALRKLGAEAVQHPATNSWSLVAGPKPQRVMFELVECSAGTYFCNDLAYRAQRAKTTAVFMHVASDEGMRPSVAAANSQAVRDTVVEHVKNGVVALARVIVAKR